MATRLSDPNGGIGLRLGSSLQSAQAPIQLVRLPSKTARHCSCTQSHNCHRDNLKISGAVTALLTMQGSVLRAVISCTAGLTVLGGAVGK